MAEKEKILVVEDNDFVRMQIVRFLTDAGYDVVEAKDGHEALQHRGPDIALAIVDMRMQPMGGLDFVRALRGEKIDTPVIVVTGDDNSDLLEQAGQMGDWRRADETGYERPVDYGGAKNNNTARPCVKRRDGSMR